MKNYLLLTTSFVFIFLANTIYGQRTTSNALERNTWEIFSKVPKKATPLDVKGTPYVKKLFNKGNIYFRGKKTRGVYLLRYNANLDYIEVLTDGEEFDKVLINDEISCKIGNDLYIHTEYIDGKTKETVKGYLKELYKNADFTVYKKENMAFFEGKRSVNPMIPPTPSRYKLYTTYYFRKNSEKDTPALYLKNFKALKKYLKKEKINIDKSELNKINKLM